MKKGKKNKQVKTEKSFQETIQDKIKKKDEAQEL